jgi:hypothetical protein
MTKLDAITIGAAGYTAALAVELMELNGLEPDRGKVLVNGASGGVASIAIDMLSQRGFQVVAATRKVATKPTTSRRWVRPKSSTPQHCTQAPVRWNPRSGKAPSIRSAERHSPRSRAPCSAKA